MGKLLQLVGDKLKHKGKLLLYKLKQVASVMKLGSFIDQDRLVSTLVTIVR